MHSLGLQNNKKELKLEEFHKLLEAILPDISQEQTAYIVKKASLDCNGYVSLHKFYELMDFHQINLTTSPEKR